MNKTGITAVITGLVALLISARAAAVLLVVDPMNPSIAIAPGDPASYVHDIGGSGYTPGTGGLTSGTIAIQVQPGGAGGATYQYGIGSTQSQGGSLPPGGGGTTDIVELLGPALDDLAADGQITVTVTSTDGTIILNESVLTVQIQQLAEPDTLLLLSAALLGVAGVTRRKQD